MLYNQAKAMGEEKKGFYEQGEFDAEEHIENDLYRKHMLSSWYKAGDSKAAANTGKQISNTDTPFTKLTNWLSRRIDKIDLASISLKAYAFALVGVVVLLVGGFLLFSTGGSSDVGSTLGALDTPGGTLTEGGLEVAGAQDTVVSREIIGSTPVKLTTQPLPQEFKDNPSDLRKLALSLESKTQIDRFATTKGVAYVAHLEGGTQSAIFASGDTLYFVVSDGVIPNETWKQYIDNL